MAWIESHQELESHPKTKKLKRLLGVPLPTVIGYLHMLWWWAMNYAQDGDLTRYEPEDVEDACHWDGEPGHLYNSLKESRFIDENDFIHDWLDYAGRLVERREQNKERKRKSRAKQKQSQIGHDDVTRDGSVTGEGVTGLPNTTQPNQTEPYPTQPNLPNQLEFGGGDLNPYRIFEQEGFGTISPVIHDEIDDLVITYGIRWYLEAMKKAVLKGKRSLAYVNGILSNWKSDGIDEPWKGDGGNEESERRTQGNLRPGRDKKESEFAHLDA